MPCQDTLYLNRMASDGAFAEASNASCAARNASFTAQQELCRAGRLLAEGVIPDVTIADLPKYSGAALGDAWGDRVRDSALADIREAESANAMLAEVGNGIASEATRAWLLKHWSADLRRIEQENERHLREIQLPRYSQGAKREKRLQRIVEDAPEIEKLKALIRWASA